jgi:hypothetical protein
MEQELQRRLLLRSTMYKDLPSDVVSKLAAIAGDNALDAKGLAGSFDKFMTVKRWEGGLLAWGRSRA